MPLIQTLFYFAGFVAFLLAAVFTAVMIFMVLGTHKKVRAVVDKFEEKMDTPITTAILPFLPTLIAIFGEFKRGKKK